MSRHNIYRDGRVHVMVERCPTCIFEPGNRMQLNRGRVRDMVDEAKADESCIVCHSTLDSGQEAVCRGFFDLHPTQPLQIADRLDLIDYDGAPLYSPETPNSKDT